MSLGLSDSLCVLCVCVRACWVNLFISNISYQSYKLGSLQWTVILLLECSLKGFYGLFL